MVNVKNLFAPLGICQIVGLVLGILVLILGIVSRPYLSVRESGAYRPEGKENEFANPDYVFAHNLFFIGIFLPLLLSILSIVLTLLDSKEKISGGGIHALIGVFCFAIAIYLLYGITTIRSNNKSAVCNATAFRVSLPTKEELDKIKEFGNTTSAKEEKEMHENLKECAKKYLDKNGLSNTWKDEIKTEYCDDCYIKPGLKFELCVAAGVFGFIYALINIGSAVLAFLAKRN